MYYEGMPGQHLWCGYVYCVGFQFCYKYIFQTLKSWRVLEFHSALCRLGQGTSLGSRFTRKRREKYPSQMWLYIKLLCVLTTEVSLCGVMGNVGLTLFRPSTELFYILEFSDHWLETRRVFWGLQSSAAETDCTLSFVLGIPSVHLISWLSEGRTWNLW